MVFVNLQQSALGPMTYLATITPPSYVQDLLPANNTASAVTEITNPADLQVQLLAAPNPSFSGQAITITATVRNVGPAPASGLQLNFQLPAGVQVHRMPNGPGWTCSLVDGNGAVTCQNPSLGSGAVSEVWLAVLPEVDASSLTVSASATSMSNDPDPENNAAELVVPIAFDAATYRKPTIGGGGFGCAIHAGAAPSSAGVGWMLLTALLLWARRRTSGRKPAGPSAA
jgi:uncharacterized repeat protein (TIGR01451 family)/MYXO-CTERM domain-containing protein